MSSGGSKFTPTTTVQEQAPTVTNLNRTTVNEIPQYLTGASQDLVARGQALTSRPYEAYTGARVAEFSPMVQQAFDRAGGQQVAGQVGEATGLASLAGQRATDYGLFGEGVQQYMNPYMQNVVDIERRKAQETSDLVGAQLAGQQIRMGAFGGSGTALQQRALQRDTAQQLADIQQQGLSRAYDQAANQYNLGITNALSASSNLGQLGQTQFGQEQDITRGIAEAGRAQTEREQALLDVGFQDYLAEQKFPYEQLAFQQGLVSGVPYTTTQRVSGQEVSSPGKSVSQTTAYRPQPNPMSQLIGAGVTAYGASLASGGKVQRYADGGVTGLLGPEELQNEAQNNQGTFRGLAAQSQLDADNALQVAAPKGLPGMGPEEPEDPVEVALLIEIEQALNEGRVQEAQALAQTVQRLREKRAQEEQMRMQEEQMGVAAAASDEMGNIPPGGITGMPMMAMGGEVHFFQGGATDPRRRDPNVDPITGLPRAQAAQGPNVIKAIGQAMSSGEDRYLNYLRGKIERGEVLTPDERARAARLGVKTTLQAPGTQITPAATPDAGIQQLVAAEPDVAQSATDSMRNRSRAAQRSAAQARQEKDTPPEAPVQGIDQLMAERARIAGAGTPAGGIDALLANLNAKREEGPQAELEDLIRDQEAQGEYGVKQEERLKAREESFKDQERKNVKMAFIRAGFEMMAGKSEDAIVNIAQGAIGGLEGYEKGAAKLAEAREKHDEAVARLEDLRYQEGKVNRKELRERKAAVKKAEFESADALFQYGLSQAGAAREDAREAARSWTSFKIAEMQMDKKGFDERAIERVMKDKGISFTEALEVVAGTKRAPVSAEKLRAEWLDPMKRMQIERDYPNVKTFEDYAFVMGEGGADPRFKVKPKP